jgi:hypothetical protein
MINFEQLIVLWNEVVENGYTVSEKDIIYKWFCDVAGGKSSIQIDDDDLKSFFVKHMCKNESMHSMTEKGFACFRVVFSIVNVSEKKMVMKSSIDSYLQNQKNKNEDNENYELRYMGMGADNYQNYHVQPPLDDAASYKKNLVDDDEIETEKKKNV